MRQNLWSTPWFMIPTLLFLNAGLALLLLIPHGAEILYLNNWRTEPLNTFFRCFTWGGEWPAYVLLGLAGMVWRFRYALLIALAGLIVSPASYILKDRIGTDRPVTYFEKRGLREAIVVVPGVDLNGGQTSFPSGHTMAAFGLYALAALFARTKAPWFGAACAWTAMLVAFSRIFLVQHFLVDILGGAVFGLFVAGLVWMINNRFFNRLHALDSGLLAFMQKRRKQKV